MEELLNQVAEMRGMPASLVKRSAEARAEKEGMTLEAVLADWAGVEVPASDAPSEPEETTVTDVPGTSPSSVAEAADESGVPAEITTDYLVKLAADAKRMPPKLILSSGKARAEHSGTPLDEVLAEWAGVDLDELKEQAAAADIGRQTSDVGPATEPEAVAAAEPEPEAVAAAEPEAEAVAVAGAEPEPEAAAEPEPEAVAAAAPVAAAVVAGIGMDELLEKVAEAKGMPAALAKRSAEARAKKTGEPLETVLAEWAGIDPATIASAGATPASTPVEEVAATEPAVSEPADTAVEEIEIIEASVGESEDEDVEAPTAKIGRYPAWLAAAFLIIPLLAVTYILISPNGPQCGTSGQLLVDPVTGNAVNCDGSAYGTAVTDYFGNGAAVFAQCQACHGTDGSGTGAGPAFTGGGILTTFPAGSCSDHIQWITLGTSGWPDPTYGANSKPVGGFGLMPAFGTSLDETQIAEVALYERVQFGGEDLAEAEADCGLTDDGSEATDGAAVEAAG